MTFWLDSMGLRLATWLRKKRKERRVRYLNQLRQFGYRTFHETNDELEQIIFGDVL